MTIQLTRPVGEIATENPCLIPLLEEMKVDYCCGGNRSLKDALVLAALPVEGSLRRLEERAHAGKEGGLVEPDWRSSSMEELIDHILEKHHGFTRSQSVRVRELAQKVAQVHGDRHPELARIAELAREMAGELEGHMAKEEEQIFPYLKAVEKAGGKKGIPDPFAGGPLDQHPLRILMWEHGMTGEEFSELHRLTVDFTPPQDACGSYRALYQAFQELEDDLHQHVHLENNVLFRKAEEAGILD